MITADELAELRQRGSPYGKILISHDERTALLDAIETLTRERDEARKALDDALELVAEYEAQWGGDYLAHKWGLKEQAAEIRARVPKDPQP